MKRNETKRNNTSPDSNLAELLTINQLVLIHTDLKC